MKKEIKESVRVMELKAKYANKLMTEKEYEKALAEALKLDEFDEKNK